MAKGFASGLHIILEATYRTWGSVRGYRATDIPTATRTQRSLKMAAASEVEGRWGSSRFPGSRSFQEHLPIPRVQSYRHIGERRPNQVLAGPVGNKHIGRRLEH